MNPPTLIAVVEDDPEIRSLVGSLLSREGFEVVLCGSGADLDRAIERRRVDLVVLDLMLPGEDGLSICRRLRSTPTSTPVLMVTAKGDDLDRIIGLEVGADDYLPKPFNPRELVARVRAILRRTRGVHHVASTPPSEVYRFAGWSLDAASRELHDPEGRAVDLTGGEYDLLIALLTHPQRVLNRDQLLDWTRGRSAAPFDRTIDVQLSRLRRKLGDDSRPPSVIKTVRGGGYLFAPAVERGRA
ncbi:response regulator [Labrys monachus]|uniref:Two-component system OmpR family response regulator n=1 Tax=Labrys monachus TaxID=217067 RepID=A0ABU0FJR5_9HYPH|nr:response regulator [Labrys monachus]MDQ0394852.1 two-component system OmpR family response regulator [Labrys monachus]